jgi:NADH:ubiquinone oxidoreductase subunit 2 (subunit N)
MAKLFVLNHAAGFGSPALVLIALVLAVASMYYYFKLINQFFTSDQSAEKAWDISWGYKGMLIVLSAITLILGLYPFGIYSWIS